MTIYAVVGASRGIGLEYVRQLAARPDAIVFAVVRNARKSNHLNAAISGMENVHVVEADVADHTTLERAAKQVSEISGGKLDCLIHNAARMDVDSVFKDIESFGSMQQLDADFITAYKTNALGVIHSITAFLPLLRASTANLKKIVVVSTGGADHKLVLHCGIANMTAYGMTKAAALMATTKWAIKLKDEGFVVVSLSPGLVDTTDTLGESGDPEAKAMVKVIASNFPQPVGGSPVFLQSPAESVADQLKLIDALKPSDNGLLLAHTGGEFVG
ncbi:NAD-P-binding protein [Daedaleopsis nitida]|nr:NAD-P-binding protein [Daedaleopsis nitida]